MPVASLPNAARSSDVIDLMIRLQDEGLEFEVRQFVASGRQGEISVVRRPKGRYEVCFVKGWRVGRVYVIDTIEDIDAILRDLA